MVAVIKTVKYQCKWMFGWLDVTEKHLEGGKVEYLLVDSEEWDICGYGLTFEEAVEDLAYSAEELLRRNME